MNDVLKPASHPNTNTRASFLKINQPLRNANHGQQARSYVAPNIWNSLLVSLKATEVLNTYKRRIFFFLTEWKIMKMICIYIAISNYYLLCPIIIVVIIIFVIIIIIIIFIITVIISIIVYCYYYHIILMLFLLLLLLLFYYYCYCYWYSYYLHHRHFPYQH